MEALVIIVAVIILIFMLFHMDTRFGFIFILGLTFYILWGGKDKTTLIKATTNDGLTLKLIEGETNDD